MARRSFEMYEIRQIIVCLRSGETIRGIAQTKLANRKKIRAVRKIAIQQNWLDTKKEIPTDGRQFTVRGTRGHFKISS